ncbi:LPS export ABC transporter periplasmic protein LptC [Thermodesulfobacteriota bacterium]
MLRVLYLFIIILLALSRCSPRDEVPSMESTKAPEPQAEVLIDTIHLSATKGDRLEWELQAESARHFEEEDFTLLRGIEAIFYADDGEIMTMKADEGTVHRSTEDVELTGHVEASTSEGYRLFGDRFAYRAGEGIVFSDDNVRMVRDGFEVKGTGVRIELESRSISILRGVHAKFSGIPN